MGEPEGTPETAEELYERAPCGYLSTLPDGTIVRVNQTLLTWTGYAREELVASKRLHDLLTVGARVYFETHVGPLLRMQGEVSEIQLELLCKGGRHLPVLLNTTLQFDDAGQPRLLRSTLFNITERKRYERELLLSRKLAEQRARQAVLAADLGRALARRLELSEQLQLCTEALVEHLDAAEVRVWSATPESGALHLSAAAGVLSAGFEQRSPSIPAREEKAAAERKVIILNDVAALAPAHDEEWIRREGVRACAALPLMAGDRFLGVLSFYARDPLTAETELALTSSSNELAVGMHRAWAERERDALLERVQAQAEELRQSRELLATTLKSIGDAVISTDAGANITFMNPVAEALTRWTSAEASGRPIEDVLKLVNETNRTDIENPVKDALRKGTIVGLENHTVLVRRDGSEIAVDDSAAPIPGAAGEVIGGVLVFRDVTAQRLAERELRTAQQRLSTVVRNAPLILFGLDANGHILISEGKGLASVGIKDPASRVGLSAFEAYAHVPWLLAEFKRALAGESFIGGGELGGLIFETHYMPTLDEHGQPSGTVGLALDVTERRHHEEMIQKTMEFEQQLLGIVSHDLRNPISAILLSASLLLRKGDVLDDQTLRLVTRIQTSGERALRLIRDLLDFTQARLGGGIPIQRAPVDLSEVVRQVLDEIEAGHPQRILSFDATGAFRGEWDADRLAQLVTNLTVNALKYSPAGTAVRVTLRDEGERVSLSVHNEGPPIPQEMLGQIFLPLRRATSRIDSAGRSVGLGLYIVKQLVSAHAGEIQVQSDAVTGTTFTVILPREPAARCESRQIPSNGP